MEYDIGIPEHSKEGRVITVEYNQFILVAVYVPNSKDDLSRLQYRTESWDKDFHDYLERINKEKNKPLILAGDLNVAHNEIDIYDARGKENSACFTMEERNSFASFLKRGYVDTFRHLYPDKQEFSFFSARNYAILTNSGWRLDYFLVSKDLMSMIEDSSIHKEYSGSDHVPI